MKPTGFTLIEMLIVVAILALAAGLVAFSLSNFRATQVLDGSAELVTGILIQARQRTLSFEGASVYGVRVTATTLTTFRGAVFPGTNQEVVTLPEAVTISQINLSGGGADVVFEHLTGATATDGDLVLSLLADSNRRRIISVRPSGIIEVN